MMTKDAISILEEVKLVEDSIYAYNEKYMKALDVAISALEHFQPVKPGKHDPVLYGCSYTCGACYRRIWEGDKYCRSCGKPVKWND